jgi:hypothetical protein
MTECGWRWRGAGGSSVGLRQSREGLLESDPAAVPALGDPCEFRVFSDRGDQDRRVAVKFDPVQLGGEGVDLETGDPVYVFFAAGCFAFGVGGQEPLIHQAAKGIGVTCNFRRDPGVLERGEFGPCGGVVDLTANRCATGESQGQECGRSPKPAGSYAFRCHDTPSGSDSDQDTNRHIKLRGAGQSRGEPKSTCS